MIVRRAAEALPHADRGMVRDRREGAPAPPASVKIGA